MTSIQKLMGHDHKFCDDLFARAEDAVASNKWTQAETQVDLFIAAMNRHFQHEEQVLFPAFEGRTGESGGPTMMMRHEHAQMRELMSAMNDAINNNDMDKYLGLSETLLIFMQQHNMKEEQILYPLIDTHCSEQVDGLMQNFSTQSDVA